MIFTSNRVQIMIANKPVNFRKGHDGLAALVKNEQRKEPFTGTVFVFRAKRAERLKLLYWDGTGLVMMYQRLEETTYTVVWLEHQFGATSLRNGTIGQFVAEFPRQDVERKLSRIA